MGKGQEGNAVHTQKVGTNGVKRRNEPYDTHWWAETQRMVAEAYRVWAAKKAYHGRVSASGWRQG